MAKNISLMGAVFPDVPSILLPQNGGGLVQFDDTTDADATAADILLGKTAYVNGTKVTGTGSGGGGGAYAWLGEGAEKIDTKDLSFNLSSGTSYDSWTPSTTETEIKAAQSSKFSIIADLNSYDYCFVTKGFIAPVYVSGTPATYRTHRVVQYYVHYYYGIPSPNTTEQVRNNTVGSCIEVSSTSNLTSQLYYSSNSLESRSASQCGPCYLTTYPSTTRGTVTSGSVTISYNVPAFKARCDASRFKTDRASAIDSANTNYSFIVEVYRVPRFKGLMSYWNKQAMDLLNAT